MRFLLELLSLLALAAGFVAAVSAAVFCWKQAVAHPDAGGQFAIAGAILTGLIAIALAIYLKPGAKDEE